MRVGVKRILRISGICIVITLAALQWTILSRHHNLQTTQLILAEVKLLEHAMEQFEMAASKRGRDTPIWRYIEDYLPTNASVFKQEGLDPLGNRYLILSNREGVAVHPDTIKALSSSARLPPGFWGRHDERVLNFIAAASVGDTNLFQEMLPSIADVDIEPRQIPYRTALGLAAEGGHGDIVVQLLQRGADPNQHKGWPLWRAVMSGDYRSVEALCKAGAEVDQKTLKHASYYLSKAERDFNNRLRSGPTDYEYVKDRKRIVSCISDRLGNK